MKYFPYVEDAYEAYKNHLETVTPAAKIKDWDELPENMRMAWSRAIEAAFDTHESHEGPFQQ